MIPREQFPCLTGNNYTITSPCDPNYNCISWAAGCNNKWWQPSDNYYWPPNILREESVEAYVEAFASLGYERCLNDNLEQGFTKIAIYMDPNNIPTHASRQCENGRWTSKLGQLCDIEHTQPSDVEGPAYGQIAVFMKRPQ